MKRWLTLCSMFCIISSHAQKVDPLLSGILRDNAQTVARAQKRKAQGLWSQPRPVYLYNKETGDSVLIDHRHEVNGVDTMSIKELIDARFNPDGSIRQLTVLASLTQDAIIPTDRLKAQNIEILGQVGDLVILNTPASQMGALSQMPEFQHINASRTHRLYNDVTREYTYASYVTDEKQTNQIPSKYTGEGVVVGVIDGGIDFNHAAFRAPVSGETRVKEVVYFSGETRTTVSDPVEIEKLTTMHTGTSHGSHTSATAAGSNIEGMGGIAPKADLILCDLAGHYNDHRMLLSVQEIFDYASKMSQPAVINMSLGDNFDFHDGLDPTIQNMSKLTGTGRIICISAGNEGAEKMSLRQTLPAASGDGLLKTVIQSKNRTQEGYSAYSNGTKILIYSNDTKGFTVQLQAVDVTTGTLYSLEEKCVYKIGSNERQDLTLAHTSNVNSAHEKSCVELRLPKFQFAEPSLELALLISGQEGQTITVIDDHAIQGYTELVGCETYPELENFVEGNADMSINTMTCNDGIISVGAYVKRTSFKSINTYNYSISSNKTLNKIATFSSYGVDDNGIARPDILAPGVHLHSAYNLYDTTCFSNQQPNSSASNYKSLTQWVENLSIGEYSRANAWGAMTGTSMACPVATGIVALWLEADPSLTPDGIRQMAKEVCLNDKWTRLGENIPSGNIVQAGLGKVDALRGIKYIENQRAGTDRYPLNETITVRNGIMTFASQNALDFHAITAPRAYAAYDFSGNTLTFRHVGTVKENTGLLVTGEGDYEVPIVPYAEAPAPNYLIGTADGAVTLQNESEAYVLSRMDGVIGFYQNVAGLTVPQGKAYLQLPDNSISVKGFTFIDAENGEEENAESIELTEEDLRMYSLYANHDNETDAIMETKRNTLQNTLYNLQGQRVDPEYQGIIISNGKKILKK